MLILVHENPLLFESLSLNAEKFLDTFTLVSDLSEGVHPDIIIMDSSVSMHLDDNLNIQFIKLGRDIKLPFHISQLISIIQSKASNKRYHFGGFRFHCASRSIHNLQGELLLKLTEKEAELLSYLFDKGREGAGANELISKIWKYSEDSETSTLDIHIYRLRQKLLTLDLKDIILVNHGMFYINKPLDF